MVKVGGCIRLYKSAAARRSAVTQLKKLGHNYFMGFRDVCKNHHAGLSFGKNEYRDICTDVYYVGNHIIH